MGCDKLTTKEFLNQYRDIEIKIKQKQEEIEHYRSVAMNISQSFDNNGIGGYTGNSDKIGRAVSKVIDLTDELTEDIDNLIVKQKEISSTINKVDDIILQNLLKYRYIHGATWEEISVQINYSYVHVCRLHEKALSKIKDVIECYI